MNRYWVNTQHCEAHYYPNVQFCDFLNTIIQTQLLSKSASSRLVVFYFFFTLFIVSSFVYLGIRDRLRCNNLVHRPSRVGPVRRSSSSQWVTRFVRPKGRTKHVGSTISPYNFGEMYLYKRLRHITYERYCDILYK